MRTTGWRSECSFLLRLTLLTDTFRFVFLLHVFAQRFKIVSENAKGLRLPRVHQRPGSGEVHSVVMETESFLLRQRGLFHV